MIPNSVTTIGYSAFSGCTSLSAITVDALNSIYSSVDGVLFNQSQTTLILCPQGKAGSYTMPNSVTTIGSSAFSSCTSLTNVTIGNSVTSIGSGAFYGCSSLTSITIPNSVTSIGSSAFSSCTGLASVTIGNSVTSVGDYAFSGCRNLTSVTIGNSVTSIGTYAFYYCSGLTSVTIGNSVTNIWSLAFYWCTNLTGIYFQGNAPSLGSLVFYGDTKATVYYLPGMTGWSSSFGGRPAFLWNPQPQTSGIMFGVRTNRFGFTITGSSNLVIVVEACTNLASPVWSPVSANTLNTFIGTNGTSYFSDPQWTNYPGRLYRLRAP